MLKRLGIVAVTAVTIGVGTAGAAPVTVNCPGTAATDDREFSITTDPGTATCYAYGPGNINGSNSDFPGWTFLDKDNADDADIPDLGFSITPTADNQGTFEISLSNWTNRRLLIAFKSGEGQFDPDWAAFLLPAGVTSGSWMILPSRAGGWSHSNLYFQDCADGDENCYTTCTENCEETPEPATMLLLGSGLLGLAAAARKRR